jgi:predicted alpha-1,2-mannosidase
VAIDLWHYVGYPIVSSCKDSYFKKVDEKTWGGLRYSTGWAPEQRTYFVARFSEPVVFTTGENTRKVFSFEPSDQPLEVKVGVSTVSIDNALANLNDEIGDRSFESIREDALEDWENELSKISVTEGDAVLKRVFYTALYHSYIAPNLISDTDGTYSEPSGKVTQCSDFQRYSTFSLWDTYRAAHPLFVLTQPQLVHDFIKSMLTHYDERGFLPIWELEANETFTMIGNHSIPVIVEAYMKGLRDFDVEMAYQACIDTVNQDHRSLRDYDAFGYVPYEKERESVSKTLEYAFDDWCVAVFAESLGKTNDAEKYYRRAQNYKNLFDRETGLMRPKHSDGTWLDDFDPYTHDAYGYRHFTEGNAWQYTWSVQHDPMGLIDLYGSNEAFLQQFDRLFDDEGDTSGHDDLVDVTGLIAQYAHGNEPSHHTVFLYNYTSKPYRTQELTKEVINSFYTDKPDGLCGNDDCGQMSTWYVFAAMGFYPMDPVSGKYELTTPAFSRIEMNLENGKIFRIITDLDPNEYIYIDRVEFNGNPVVDSFITYDMIMNGGELKYYLQNQMKGVDGRSDTGSCGCAFFGVTGGPGFPQIMITGLVSFLPFGFIGARIRMLRKSRTQKPEGWSDLHPDNPPLCVMK